MVPPLFSWPWAGVWAARRRDLDGPPGGCGPLIGDWAVGQGGRKSWVLGLAARASCLAGLGPWGLEFRPLIFIGAIIRRYFDLLNYL